MDLNREQLKLVSSTPTAHQLVDALAKRRRLSHETNLDRLETVMKRQGVKIVPEEFESFWKGLEASGAGSIIHGRGKRPTRFKWYYNLKDVGAAIVNPDKSNDIQKVSQSAVLVVPKIDKAKPGRRKGFKMKRRGRPVGSKNKPSIEKIVNEMRQLTEQLSKLVP